MVYTAHVYAFRFWFASCNAYIYIVECLFWGQVPKLQSQQQGSHWSCHTQRLSQNYFVTSVVHLEYQTMLYYYYYYTVVRNWLNIDMELFHPYCSLEDGSSGELTIELLKILQSQVCWLTQWFRGTTSSCLPSYKCSLDAEQENSIITIGHQWRRCLQ